MKINVKRSRPKSDEEKLRLSRLKMNSMDDQKVVFMPGESLSDDDEAPAEISIKKTDEVPEIESAEEEIPEAKLRPKKTKSRTKKKVIEEVASGEFVVKTENTRFKVLTQDANPLRNHAPKISFRDRLIRTGKDRRRKIVKSANYDHIEKWSRRMV
ncbi:hypothetical protein M3Y94_01162000 [Aphelenchoides besseyi]|nr:hypothetical protein M3Y94_01162000 [Aphelenchoides besseyi]KAI6228078.1 hypothetical protein M3Y95_00584500 [Aphelenchoides besseyi]